MEQEAADPVEHVDEVTEDAGLAQFGAEQAVGDVQGLGGEVGLDGGVLALSLIHI